MEQDLDGPLALRIAQIMVVFLRRPGGQSQFSATLEAQTRESRPLGDLLGWLPDHLRRELSVEELARRAAMSPRNCARLFRQELGKTPGKHIEDLRLEAARRQLESTSRTVEQILDACGFSQRRSPPPYVPATPASHTWSISSVIWENWTCTECVLQSIGSNRWFIVRRRSY